MGNKQGRADKKKKKEAEKALQAGPGNQMVLYNEEEAQKNMKDSGKKGKGKGVKNDKGERYGYGDALAIDYMPAATAPDPQKTPYQTPHPSNLAVSAAPQPFGHKLIDTGAHKEQKGGMDSDSSDDDGIQKGPTTQYNQLKSLADRKL